MLFKNCEATTLKICDSQRFARMTVAKSIYLATTTWKVYNYALSMEKIMSIARI